jgi:hypothetical protein
MGARNTELDDHDVASHVCLPDLSFEIRERSGKHGTASDGTFCVLPLTIATGVRILRVEGLPHLFKVATGRR